MELGYIRSKLTKFIKKYRYVLLILLLGITLMLLPDGKNEEMTTETVSVPTEPDISERLADILGQIQGVGNVRVLLTNATGEEMIYQTNTNTSTDTDSYSEQSSVVTVSDGNRGEAGLVRQVVPPKYLGAVVVCQGADHPAVHLAVVEAVSDVTGLGSDRVSVLKMK